MIKRFGLAAAAAFAVFAAPLTASAADKADAPKPYVKEQLEKGAKEGPAVLAKASGVTCTPTAWAFMGEGTVKDPTTKKDVKQGVYEVACQEGLGYALISSPDKVETFDCITIGGAAQSSIKCKLPANVDTKAQLQPIVARSGQTCTVTDGRSIGATAAGETYYEVACQGGTGLVLKTKAGAKPEATDCAQTLGSSAECKLTTKEQIEAAQKAKITTLLAKSGKQCAVSGTRTIGRVTTGDEVYEVACGSTGGFMLLAKPNGSVLPIDCAKANGIAGGCTLTNSAVAQTQSAAAYTRLAKAAGFDCNVNKYNFIGMQQKSEVVELACANRPDGGIAIFPDDNRRGVVYDCVVGAGRVGQRCQLNNPVSTFGKYTQALAARGRTSCKVNEARWLGHYEKENTDLIETGCSDGNPGWVVEIAANQTAKSLYSCGQAKSMAGVTCKLPGNVK